MAADWREQSTIRSSGGRLSCAMFREADTPIDNNPVENAIRPITLGRRNWLFTGSERAGCRAAAIQSLLATAKLNGLEPYAWLQDVLESFLPGRTAGLMNSCRSGHGGPLVTNFATLLDAMNQGSGFELYRLRAAIDRVLADPKWIIAILFATAHWPRD